MILASELTGDREIIFPEITAIAIGYLVAPKTSWAVNDMHMLWLISGCAIIGVMIVCYSGLDVYGGILLAFAIAQLLYIFAGTTFAPLISAIVLPVLLRTTSWVYPVAAFLETGFTIFWRHGLVGLGILSDKPFVPVKANVKTDVPDALLRLLVVAVLGFVALRAGYK